MTEVQILIAGTVISIINIFLFLYNINKDRGIFSINTITTFFDHKKKLKIKVTFSNVGHRPLYLKSIEYLDWNTNEIKGRNISMATVVKESELKYCIFL
ncbi:MAG: hypothetical protein EOL97_07825 [Spirochaetia bacterium]|nr:hypothetical protein [Spirochaetia bacterium]